MTAKNATRLSEAQERLQAALLSGDDPGHHRTLIARLEADEGRQRASDAEAAAQAAAAAQEDVAARSAALLAEAVARLDAVLVSLPQPAQVAGAGEQLEPLAHALAQAESDLRAARDRHASARDRMEAVQVRIDATQARRAELRAKLAAGELGDREAGALLSVVAEDLADLERMRDEAVAAAESVRPTNEEASLAATQAALARVERLAAVELARRHIAAAEAVLVDTLRSSVGLLHAAGQSATLGYIWAPSNDLRRAVQFGVLPGHV